MTTYIHIDSMNLFFRSANSISPGAGIDSQIGMAFHIILSSLRKSWNDFDGDHVIWHMEGRSWRKQTDKKYKLNRKIAALAKTEAEQETSAIMLEAFNDMCSYIDEKTNVTTLRCPIAEADDTIAHFIQTHPDDTHIIISSDSDFVQLLAPNVIIYNGPGKYTLSLKDGFIDDKNKPVIDKKTKLPKAIPDPEYALFFKCIRGDKSDNIFSAYPGVREKGTKNRVGIIEAFEDRKNKGFAWNNFMLQKWVDHEDNDITVKDAYAHNKLLIDLTLQPEHVKTALDETQSMVLSKDPVPAPSVGIHFLKFCSRWDLARISAGASDFAKILNAKYPTT